MLYPGLTKNPLMVKFKASQKFKRRYMNPVVLLPDGAKYSGQYVCLKSFADRAVVSHGKNPDDVMKEAENKGFSHPVILYVPEKGVAQIY